MEKHEGLYQLGIGCMAFAPLKTLLTEPRVKSLIAEQRKKIEERAGSLPPGLKEQYDIQLEVLESGEGADIEIAHVPGYIFPVGTSEPGKSYMAMVAAMNHNFSRGSVVRFEVSILLVPASYLFQYVACHISRSSC